MAKANFTSIDPSQFAEILQDLAISQVLSDDAGRMAIELYGATGVDDVALRVQSIAAVCQKSVSLNAKSYERLQEIFDAITVSAAPRLAQLQS
jgi:glycine cleavage system pyridoxal-binding protein P